jgi:hypothetical protein
MLSEKALRRIFLLLLILATILITQGCALTVDNRAWDSMQQAKDQANSPEFIAALCAAGAQTSACGRPQ